MIAIIVVNFGTSRLIREYFNDLSNVFIIDNYLSADERSSICLVAEELSADLVMLPTNRGFGAAVNEGVRRAAGAGYSSFLVVNPDLRIDQMSVDRLDVGLGARPQQMIAPCIDLPDGSRWFEGSTLLRWRGMARHAPWSAPDDTPWLTGACLGFTLDQWKVLDGFDERYFLYWEDVDFTYRWRAHGGQLLVDREVVAVHDVGGSQGGSGKSELYTKMMASNRWRFAKRNLSRSESLRWAIATPLFILSLVKNANHKGNRRRLSHLSIATKAALGLDRSTHQ